MTHAGGGGGRRRRCTTYIYIYVIMTWGILLTKTVYYIIEMYVNIMMFSHIVKNMFTIHNQENFCNNLFVYLLFVNSPFLEITQMMCASLFVKWIIKQMGRLHEAMTNG